MTDHGFARAVAIWARNPCGFSWADVKPNYTPLSVDDVRNWAHQDCRDAGIMGNARDDAFDRIDAVILMAIESRSSS